jgi:hypothetical protein
MAAGSGADSDRWDFGLSLFPQDLAPAIAQVHKRCNLKGMDVAGRR